MRILTSSNERTKVAHRVAQLEGLHMLRHHAPVWELLVHAAEVNLDNEIYVPNVVVGAACAQAGTFWATYLSTTVDTVCAAAREILAAHTLQACMAA